jgi:hypothetical protein
MLTGPRRNQRGSVAARRTSRRLSPPSLRCGTRSLRSLGVALVVVLAASGAGATAAQAKSMFRAEFSCTAVTYIYEGFPNANNNTTHERTTVDHGTFTLRTFHFNGPTGTDVVPVAVAPGNHTLDAFATWRTNGARGGRDIGPHNVTCAADPAFTIEKRQKMAGASSYTTETLPSTHVPQTVEYEILVTNTGNVPLTLSGFTDPKCETITGGPGEKQLGVGEQTIYFCHHALNKADGEAGVHCNVATVTGENGSPKTQESNSVCVELPEKSNFTQGVSCKQVTVYFYGFPKTTGNTVEEVIRVDKKIVFKQKITFNGSSFSNTVVLNVPPGHHKIDVFAHWKTNGVSGGADHNQQHGINCTPEPSFTIEKRQKIGAGSYTKEPLAGEVTQTVNYEVIVTNTGNVPLKFNGGFSDPNCDGGTESGGPGEAAVVTGESTTYFCSRLLKEGGANSNTATDTGTPTEGSPVTNESNTVVVNVPPKPSFTIEDTQRIAGEPSYTTSPIKGKVKQFVEYEVNITNTGNVPLEFPANSFFDVFASIEIPCTGAPTVLAPTQSAHVHCEEELQESGVKEDKAGDTGDPPKGDGGPIMHESIPVVVEVSP